jgi:hypothetical protein
VRLSDIISKDPITGRAQVYVVGYPATIVLPNNLSDWHEMGFGRKCFVGFDTPGMTWSDGCFLNMARLALTYARSVVKTVIHEGPGHWWEMWKVMGPTDFKATYGWQGVLKLAAYGPKAVHAKHPQENKAREVTERILAAVDELIRTSQPARFDTLPWLNEHYPAKR